MTPSERLLFLADALEQNAADEHGMRFDLGVWLETPFARKQGRDCGTTGCAMGLACLLPEFQALGLGNGSMGAPRFDGVVAFDAAARFFDIAVTDAKYLFSAAWYGRTPARGAEGEREVAKRIRQYVMDPAAAAKDMSQRSPSFERISST